MNRLLAMTALLLLAFGYLPPAHADDEKPIEIANLKRDGEVSFAKEILPILRKNCLACHSSSDAESELVLETPAMIIKGGAEGPAVVPGKAEESLLLQLASRQRESFMPPDDNEVGAKTLTKEQLGLIKLWIEQGAKGEVGASQVPLQWQPLPPQVNPIFSVAVTPSGQYAAAGRANQIFIYHVPAKRELGRLTDPKLLESDVYSKPGVAFFDMVQAMAFSPDGQLLAAGGYRTVKLFRRPVNQKKHSWDLPGDARATAISPDRQKLAAGYADGTVKLVELASGEVTQTIQHDDQAVVDLDFSVDGTLLAVASADGTLGRWLVSTGESVGKPQQIGQAVTSLAQLNDAKIAAGYSDKVIRIWDLAAPRDPSTDSPLAELKGHSGDVTGLLRLSADGARLASASSDGSIRMWDVVKKSQIRAFAHGGSVRALAATEDVTRIVSGSDSSKSAKLWDAASGKSTAELRSDFEALVAVNEQTQLAALAKKRVDLVKADLEAAKKRKADEEKSAKSADEAEKKAADEQKKKEEAAQKQATELEKAETQLADAKASKTKAESDQQRGRKMIASAPEAIAKHQKQALALAKRSKQAADALAIAKQAFEQASQAAKSAPENKPLAEVVASLKQATEKAAERKKTIEAEQQTQDEALASSQQAKVDGEALAKKAEQQMKDAEAKIKASEASLKKVTDAEKKAQDELRDATRNLAAAKRNAQRAHESVQKAAAELPEIEAIIADEQKRQAAADDKLKHVKQQHSESQRAIVGLACSADGRTMAMADEAGFVFTIDTESHAVIETFHEPDAKPITLAFDANNDLIAISANKVVVWDCQPEWKLLHSIGGFEDQETFPDRVTALAFSHDGRWLAAGSGEPSRSGTIKLFDTGDGSLVKQLTEPHSDTVLSLEFSPDDAYLASTAADRFMKVFDVGTGKFLRGFEGHTHHVLGVSWSADGRTLATSGADKVIKVWDFRTGDQKRTISGFSKEVTAIQFLAIGGEVAASCGDKRVHIKNADNGKSVRTLQGGGDYMFCVDVSLDGKTIIAGGQDSVLRVWSSDGKTVHNFAPPEPIKTASVGNF